MCVFLIWHNYFYIAKLLMTFSPSRKWRLLDGLGCVQKMTKESESQGILLHGKIVFMQVPASSHFFLILDDGKKSEKTVTCCTVWHHVTTLHTRLKTLEKLRSTKLSSDVLNNVGETEM